jgi:hypothetical protein
MRYERTMNVMVANTKPFLFAKLYNTCSTSDMIKCCDCSDIMRLHTSMNTKKNQVHYHLSINRERGRNMEIDKLVGQVTNGTEMKQACFSMA